MGTVMVVLISVVLVGACADGPSTGEPVIDRVVAAQDDAVSLTLEEAGLLAGGALVDIYGLDADPVPVRVDSDRDTHKGQTVWRLDVTVDVSLGGRRTGRQWRMWVGTPADGPPAVLRAMEVG